MRSIVRAYINSEQDQDREHAHQLCEKYGLDYELMRKIILAGMVAFEKKRLAALAPSSTKGR